MLIVPFHPKHRPPLLPIESTSIPFEKPIALRTSAMHELCSFVSMRKTTDGLMSLSLCLRRPIVRGFGELETSECDFLCLFVPSPFSIAVSSSTPIISTSFPYLDIVSIPSFVNRIDQLILLVTKNSLHGQVFRIDNRIVLTSSVGKRHRNSPMKLPRCCATCSEINPTGRYLPSPRSVIEIPPMGCQTFAITVFIA
ncbi:hypothetical protein F3Y22_tig00111276pilonHSYRG00133 [Hibiscus syriacus]|uniref:Uncharacterized protein n=1 Tax=Hibiscus syriacus TaxID=106335 RepID=A0A6A2YS91_HIBSY|nr:hypothetical protein F3Y22_tig00111276pilonHSYRG00133 [Hibiscus syriacus]